MTLEQDLLAELKPAAEPQEVFTRPEVRAPVVAVAECLRQCHIYVVTPNLSDKVNWEIIDSGVKSLAIAMSVLIKTNEVAEIVHKDVGANGTDNILLEFVKKGVKDKRSVFFPTFTILERKIECPYPDRRKMFDGYTDISFADTASALRIIAEIPLIERYFHRLKGPKDLLYMALFNELLSVAPQVKQKLLSILDQHDMGQAYSEAEKVVNGCTFPTYAQLTEEMKKAQPERMIVEQLLEGLVKSSSVPEKAVLLKELGYAPTCIKGIFPKQEIDTGIEQGKKQIGKDEYNTKDLLESIKAECKARCLREDRLVRCEDLREGLIVYEGDRGHTVYKEYENFKIGNIYLNEKKIRCYNIRIREAFLNLFPEGETITVEGYDNVMTLIELQLAPMSLQQFVAVRNEMEGKFPCGVYLQKRRRWNDMESLLSTMYG